MEQRATLEHPTENAEFLTNVVGKGKIRDIRFGYRLENDEPAIKFRITLRFPYSIFARKKVEVLVEQEMAHVKLANALPSRLLFHIQ